MTQKFRQGDIVTIRAVVEYHYTEGDILRDQVKIRIEDANQSVFVKPDRLTMQIPFFAPGERVQKKNSPDRTGVVVANAEEEVWVRFDNGKHGTVAATDLEPIEGRGLHVVAA